LFCLLGSDLFEISGFFFFFYFLSLSLLLLLLLFFLSRRKWVAMKRGMTM
jgi:hypothetical protein